MKSPLTGQELSDMKNVLLKKDDPVVIEPTEDHIITVPENFAVYSSDNEPRFEEKMETIDHDQVMEYFDIPRQVQATLVDTNGDILSTHFVNYDDFKSGVMDIHLDDEFMSHIETRIQKQIEDRILENLGVQLRTAMEEDPS